MTPEAKDKLLANAIALRGDIESLIERIDAEANRRNVNPFWARWLARTLMHDRNALNIAIDRAIFSEQARRFADTTAVYQKLANAYEATSFAMTFSQRLLMEELGEM